MKYMKVENDDIYYNLALEEYILKNCREDEYFLLWRSDTCIVIGKYQNVFEEVNIKEAEMRGIKIARRNSGGGAVFHDKGNLNFSFITDYNPETFPEYDDFLEPVIEILNRLGIPAEKKNKSDIVINDMKISGNAQVIRHGRILHHGTLLFDADMEALHMLLRPSEADIDSKAVKSVRSRVANIAGYINTEGFTIEDFSKYIAERITAKYDAEKFELTCDEIEIVNSISEKYRTWQWNYAYSPEFLFRKKNMIQGKELNVEMHISGGIIEKCCLYYGDDNNDKLQMNMLKGCLTDQKYSYKTVSNIVRMFFGNEISEEITDCFF